ncbi:MBL fold metallo-hydrolase [Actinoplanes sp. URMC 104]|uniref:MBL fold metallo-hydrolase n=1 Tax=Actinoplanes sp. URMC 104 TaxID=3423409 RepID=UPI003F1E17F9
MQIDGITRVPLPVGHNGIETVNVYVLADGQHVTLVDCGVWRPGPDGDGLGELGQGLRTAGYELADVSRIVVTHAHIDHYGLAGRLMELTGAELWMHALTDLDCEKYRHPDTAVARRRDTYTDHGLPSAELPAVAHGLRDWLPYLYSVVEASTRLRGGEKIPIGGQDWEVLHTPGHSTGHICLWSPALEVVLSGDHLLPGVTPPVTFERGFDANPLGSYLDSLRRVEALRAVQVLPGHGTPFRDVQNRIEAILRNKLRRLQAIREAVEDGPKTVVDITDRVFSRVMLEHRRGFALAETLAHIAYLRHDGVVERRIRPDGVYEWYATGETR